MKILAIIPARGGSKGIPRKNIRPLAGKPLIAWTLEAARAATRLDRIIVSTEDEEIAAIARACGAEVPFLRPAELAGDDTPTLAALQHVVAKLQKDESYCPDAVMTLQPTSPLRTAVHIDEAADLFAADPQADSLVSCVKVPHVFHPRSVMKRTADGYLAPYLDETQPFRRQDKETVFARNGAAVYITRTPCLERFVFGGKLIGYPMDERSSVDIDTQADWMRAETLLNEGLRPA